MQLSKKYLKWLSVSYWRKRERQLIKVNNKLDRFLYLLEYNVMAEKGKEKPEEENCIGLFSDSNWV